MAMRRVTIKRGKGKLRGRYCVKVFLARGDKHAAPRRRNLRGNAAPIRMYGCFTGGARAKRVASWAANTRTLGRLPSRL